MRETWIIVNGEYRELKEAVACFKMLSRHLSGGTEGVGDDN
jgi:hypothetical protein